MTHEELRAAGYDVEQGAHARLARFVALLLEENARINLTAAKSPAEIWRGHVCDSLALLTPLRELSARTLLDLGSGGGFPGLPIACVRVDIAVTLVEATRKKAAALQRMIRDVQLAGVRVLCGRAETLAHDPAQRERYDVVTARAVAHLRVLLEYAAGFVRPGGHCLFFKSAGAASEESGEAVDAAEACGLAAAGGYAYQVPGEAGMRPLLCYRKQSPLSPDLPRSPGRAKKRPL